MHHTTIFNLMETCATTREVECWWHVTINMHGTWLPGDARGFRSSGHRIHSSGDYRHRPPPEEHRGLREHANTIARQSVQLDSPQRALLGGAMLISLNRADAGCIAAAISATHAHLLMKHKAQESSLKKLITRIKQTTSYRVRDKLPGKIWSKGSSRIQIRDRDHQLGVFQYIVAHRTKENAWVWTFDGR